MGGKRHGRRHGKRVGGGDGRHGNLAATARLIHPNADAEIDPDTARRLVAGLCRLIGSRVTATSTWPIQAGEELGRQLAAERAADRAAGGKGPSAEDTGVARHGANGTAPPVPGPLRVGLAPRLEQTLSHLLRGDSEKQIAAKLNISRHTVHVYVKSLYRHYQVSSRGELLARWVRQ